jgi:hypothetical protein
MTSVSSWKLIAHHGRDRARGRDRIIAPIIKPTRIKFTRTASRVAAAANVRASSAALTFHRGSNSLRARASTTRADHSNFPIDSCHA